MWKGPIAETKTGFLMFCSTIWRAYPTEIFMDFFYTFFCIEYASSYTKKEILMST